MRTCVVFTFFGPDLHTEVPTDPGASLMAEDLRVGIVGAGMIAGVHARPYRGVARSARSWPSPTRCSPRPSGWRTSTAPWWLPDLDALLDLGVDVVDVCTPPQHHADLAVAALRAGRHVLCEKPLARTLEDARTDRRAAADAPGLLMVGPRVPLRARPPRRQDARSTRARSARCGWSPTVTARRCRGWSEGGLAGRSRASPAARSSTRPCTASTSPGGWSAARPCGCTAWRPTAARARRRTPSRPCATPTVPWRTSSAAGRTRPPGLQAGRARSSARRAGCLELRPDDEWRSCTRRDGDVGVVRRAGRPRASSGELAAFVDAIRAGGRHRCRPARAWSRCAPPWRRSSRRAPAQTVDLDDAGRCRECARADLGVALLGAAHTTHAWAYARALQRDRRGRRLSASTTRCRSTPGGCATTSASRSSSDADGAADAC